MARLHLIRDEGLDLPHRGPVADLSSDRLPAGWRVPEGADRQVPVDGQRQRAGDWRRSQGEHVRFEVAGLGLEGPPLGHAKAVLLVDHGEAEAVEADRITDNGVGPDDDVDGTETEASLDVALGRRPERPSQELDPDAERRGQSIDDRALVGDRRVEQRDATREGGGQPASRLQRETGLPHPTAADEGDDPGVRPLEPSQDLAKRALTPDEGIADDGRPARERLIPRREM